MKELQSIYKAKPRGKKYPDSSIFEFPFKCMHPRYGRIEWWLEFFRASKKEGNRYYINKILVWANQTDDKRYSGKNFEIPCHCEQMGGSFRDNSYLSGVWSMGYCNLHKQFMIGSYPKENHTKLIIDVSSSILTKICFE